MSLATELSLHNDDRCDEEEWNRLQQLNIFEELARKRGCKAIVGIDEAGRGPLAGPVVAAACMISTGVFFPGVDDSKKLLPKKRQQLFQRITSHPNVCYGIGIVSASDIDLLNIYQATIQAMMQAIANLPNIPDYLLVDGMMLNHATIPSEKIIKGDAKSQSIAAASIIAKETRDQLMREYDLQYPDYGFAQHKGYSTQKHIEAIKLYGPSPIHRYSFEPIKSCLL